MKNTYIVDKENIVNGKLTVKGIFSENDTIPEEYKDEIRMPSKDFLFFEHPYYDSEENTIKNKTKLMLYKESKYQLGIGEIYDESTDEIIAVRRPSQHHKWSGTEWVVNLDEVKFEAREKLKKIRRDKVNENIVVNNSEFQVREQDLENFYDVKLAVELKEKELTDKRYWVLADNTLKEFTYKELIDVLKARANRKDEIYMKFGGLSMQLAKAQTLEEIEAIKWED